MLHPSHTYIYIYIIEWVDACMWKAKLICECSLHLADSFKRASTGYFNYRPIDVCVERYTFKRRGLYALRTVEGFLISALVNLSLQSVRQRRASCAPLSVSVLLFSSIRVPVHSSHCVHKRNGV